MNKSEITEVEVGGENMIPIKDLLLVSILCMALERAFRRTSTFRHSSLIFRPTKGKFREGKIKTGKSKVKFTK